MLKYLAAFLNKRYCDYDNSPSNGTTYGRLYNWFAVNDSRKIALTGWHVSSDAEWTVLTTYLGGADIADGKLKEKSTTHWLNPNTGATNENGFTSLPGGFRYEMGPFESIGIEAEVWSATEAEDYDNVAWFFYINNSSNNAITDRNEKKRGLSIRCLKD